MKVLALNCSPRKNWNTAKLLKSALKGAESAGAEVEYIDLYGLNFTGCRSCMLCKRKVLKDAAVIGKTIFPLLSTRSFPQMFFL